MNPQVILGVVAIVGFLLLLFCYSDSRADAKWYKDKYEAQLKITESYSANAARIRNGLEALLNGDDKE